MPSDSPVAWPAGKGNKSVFTPEVDTQNDRELAALFSGMADNTGMHGVPNIKRSKSFFRKMFWLLILCAGLGLLIWQLVVAFNKFNSYPVATKIEAVSATSITFPAVTVCNMNPMRMSAVDMFTGDDWGSFTGQSNSGSSGSGSDWEYTPGVTGRPPAFNDWESADNAGDYYDTDDEDFELQESFLEKSADLSVQERFVAGHQLSTMLLNCQFQGKKCSPRNFTRINNYLYGNCFTFNHGINQTVLSVNKLGPVYGLVLELYIEQDEYLEGVADAAGVRVVIHNQTEMPFPEDYGFSVSPGQVAFVGLERVEIWREKPKYGNCVDSSDSLTDANVMWADRLPHLKYSTAACKKTCYQRSLMRRCSCGDTNYPLSSRAFDNNSTHTRACNSSKPLQVECKNNITNLFNEGKLGCGSLCNPRCLEVRHDRTMSYATWPSNVKKNAVIDTLLKSSEELYDKLDAMSDGEFNSFPGANVLKLRIYFKDLDYTAIITAASYQENDLLSDLGGQVGLWLGFSVITFFEFVELLGDVIVYILRKCWPKNRRTTTPVQFTKGNDLNAEHDRMLFI